LFYFEGKTNICQVVKFYFDVVMSVNVKKILLDSLKSRDLSIVDLSKALCSVNGVSQVEIVVVEVDSNTETLKVIISGPQINYGEIREVMGKYGVSIKGVDEITVAKDNMP
jgi:hypothetical protein